MTRPIEGLVEPLKVRTIERLFRGTERPPKALRAHLQENDFVIHCEEFEIKTGGQLDALDVTEEVRDTLRASGVTNGSVLVFSPHTTCCVVVGRPGAETARSLEATMSAIAPEDGYYAHDDLSIRTENLVHDEPANAPAHILHAVAGKASECIPIADGELLLGEDQHVLFVELDSSRKRRYLIQILGE